MYLKTVFFYITLSYCLTLFLHVLQHSFSKKPLPSEFRNIYTEEEKKAVPLYIKANRIYSIFKETFFTVLLFVFLYFRGFSALSSFVESFGLGPIASGVLFCVSFFTVLSLLEIPFSLYHTFCIEKKFGLTSITLKTIILDFLKGGILSICLILPLLIFVLWIFSKHPHQAALIVFIIIVSWQIFISFIAPVVILPLFNSFRNLEDTELLEKIEHYCKVNKFPHKGVFVTDGSRRSEKANAYFVGFGRFRRIVLYDTLLKKMTTEEIMAILAHEMGHYKRKHIFKQHALGLIQTLFSVYLFQYLLRTPEFFMAFSIATPAIQFLIPPFVLFIGVFQEVFGTVSLFLSRKYEYEADAYSVNTNHNPEALISGLKKLIQNHFSPILVHPYSVFFRYSHPPIVDRVAHLRKLSS